MVLVEARVELEADRQCADDFKVVVLPGLIIDHVLAENAQIVTNKDGNLDFLLDIICEVKVDPANRLSRTSEILQPENSDGIGLASESNCLQGGRSCAELKDHG